MKCSCNSKIRCWITRDRIQKRQCPLNSKFQTILEKAVLIGRELKSTDIKKFLQCGIGTNNAGDDALVRKSDVAVCFRDWDKICILVGLLHRKDIDCMTSDICKDLIRGESIFRDRLKGFDGKQAKKFADRKIKRIWATL